MALPTLRKRRGYEQFEGTVNNEPSMTAQHHKDESDVNFIMDQINVNSLESYHEKYATQYVDFSDSKSYEDSLNIILKADNMFSDLPSNLRNEFNNNPTEFIEFFNNPENIPRMRELGLLPPEQGGTGGEQPPKEEVVPPPVT